ncbi:serine protease [Brachionus plicatilis]|uniref:Serine protease n=1 Tax=Brachionus plicatilis TaxID=10195 RepID=A0A3M7SA87_BRAPC|nr:serine protease [Brachionus plicatilis]
MVYNKETFFEFHIKRNHGHLGFNIDGGETKPIGIYISKIEKNSVAEIAGLKVYDLILTVNDKDFTKILIHQAIQFFKSADLFKIKVKRYMVPKRNTIKENYECYYSIIKLKKQNKKCNFGFKLNFVVEENKRNKLTVISVESNSFASNSNLKTGDIILAINNLFIESLDDFYKAVQIFKNTLSLQLVVIRRKNKFYENSCQQKLISMEGINLLDDQLPNLKKFRSNDFLSGKNDFFRTAKILNAKLNDLYDNLFYPQY